jgi:RNA 2',3'-cyclic 3'-phosphodiesterase
VQSVFDFYQEGPERPKYPERLFYSLIPDPETSARTVRFRENFCREHEVEGALLRPERLHLTLQHVGDYKRLRGKLLYAVQLAAEAVAMAPFEVTFRSITSFDGAPSLEGAPPRRPLVLLGESEALFELHKSLGAAMRRYGLKASDGFMPHMTLSYGPRAIAQRAIEPIRFAVREFVLVHSRLRLTQYEMLERWPLRG